MWHFRLGRIPVTVHFSHFAFSALLLGGLAMAVAPALLALVVRPQLPGNPWPQSVLSDPQSAGYFGHLVVLTAMWVGIVFVSVLVHELGHALVSRAFGYSPAIQLVFLGGNTNPNAPGPIPWHRDVLLTLAGPGFGLTLGVLAFVLDQLVGHHSHVLAYGLTMLFAANLIWAIYNLLPVTPLDGGRVTQALSMRLFGRPGFLIAHVFGLLVGLAVVAYGLRQGFVMVAVMMGISLMQTVALISAYFRGEAPAREDDPVEALALRQGDELYVKGDLDGARREFRRLAEETQSPSLRGRAFHRLGWVALKLGEGRQALDAFSQAGGSIPIEPHALAAAFSLVGDDERSLPLWEQAVQRSDEATLRNEWAGALLRLGRVDEARRVTGDELATAYRFAERVLFLRGRFEEAARMGEEALALKPDPTVAYNAACAYARAHDKANAVRLLERASGFGFSDAETARSDPDLHLLSGYEPFERWLSTLR